MFKSPKAVLMALAIATLLTTATVSNAQTTGSVTMNATVSNFVELTSGGAVTLTGNSGGSVITDPTQLVSQNGQLTVDLTVASSLDVDGTTVGGQGKTFYQFVLPIVRNQPNPTWPTSEPTTKSTN